VAYAFRRDGGRDGKQRGGLTACGDVLYGFSIHIVHRMLHGSCCLCASNGGGAGSVSGMMGAYLRAERGNRRRASASLTLGLFFGGNGVPRPALTDETRRHQCVNNGELSAFLRAFTRICGITLACALSRQAEDVFIKDENGGTGAWSASRGIRHEKQANRRDVAKTGGNISAPLAAISSKGHGKRKGVSKKSQINGVAVAFCCGGA